MYLRQVLVGEDFVRDVVAAHHGVSAQSCGHHQATVRWHDRGQRGGERFTGERFEDAVEFPGSVGQHGQRDPTTGSVGVGAGGVGQFVVA